MVNGVSGAGHSYAPSVWSQEAPGGELGRDAFLQLLVTQLRNQDPLNPLEARDMVVQLAQFSTLEQLHNLTQGMSDLALGMESLNLGVESLNIGSVRLEAMALLGRAVRLVGGSSGLVTAVNLAGGLPELTLDDGTTFGLDDVAEVLQEMVQPQEDAVPEEAALP